jgi:hypothetical protein
VAGADGSGHVAVLHLYALHVYPALQGWVPELFGGMPFPVYYPPLFYWIGATIMWLTGGDASFAAKLLTTISFAALPGTLYLLGRRVGLRSSEAGIASGAAAVVACGSNVVSLSGIGLLGLFEVGLFTQTLGFVFFCLWAGCLPRARHSPRAAIGAILFLTATVLTNAHIMPLVACYALAWVVVSLLQTINSRSELSVRDMTFQLAAISCLLLAPVLITGLWLVPLIKWYPYSVGHSLSSAGLFTSLGSLNIVWPLCAVVCWRERKRRRQLSVLCVALLLTAAVSLTPAGELFRYPFQPGRVISGALLLCTLPVTFALGQLLTEIAGGQERVVQISLCLCILVLAWLHPMQPFSIGSINRNDADQIEAVRAAVSRLPPGKVLVEMVESTEMLNPSQNRLHERASARALTHRIASDGRPILWSVFREQSVIAPFATAVGNLFSTTKETFGISGLGIRRSVEESVSIENGLFSAANLGCAYLLVKTPAQVDKLRNIRAAGLLWSVNGWSLFANPLPVSSEIEAVKNSLVIAWMPAKFKSRHQEDVDLFNLGEQLAFEGSSDVLPLWAQSEGVDVWDAISKVPSATVIIDPASLPSDIDGWLGSLNREKSKLKLILLDDGSQLSARIDEECHSFLRCERIEVSHLSGSLVISELSREVIQTQSEISVPNDSPWRLWRTTYGYFPARRTVNDQFTFLTGQGSAAVLSPTKPILRWYGFQPWWLSLTVSSLGLILSLVYVNSICGRPVFPSATRAFRFRFWRKSSRR